MNAWLFSAYIVVVVAITGYAWVLAGRDRRLAAEEVALRRRKGAWDDYAPAGGWGADALAFLAAVGFCFATFMGFIYAPTEKTMGTVQRIFYFHVPSAWVGGLAFLVVFVGSVVYLATRSERADRLAAVSAEVGVLFTSIVLITGPLWGKPVWGIWWTWDARLTSTLILWLIYVGYLMVRSQVPDPRRRSTLAAVVGILGFVDVPLVYFSIRWWRTQHPQPVIAGGPGSGLETHMLYAFFAGLAVFTVLYLALLVRGMDLATRAAKLDALHRRLED